MDRKIPAGYFRNGTVLRTTPTDMLFERLSVLYRKMERAYDQVAREIGLSCEGCPDNCCDSFFCHHTVIEWAYVWKGIGTRSETWRQGLVFRAEAYVEQSRLLLAEGEKPNIMCPLNENGLCQLYPYRLMICRMHGVPNRFVRPDGKKMTFPGCIRSQALCRGLKEVPLLDRTHLYRELASLEMALVGPGIKKLPRVNLTLAEMILQGPPKNLGISF